MQSGVIQDIFGRQRHGEVLTNEGGRDTKDGSQLSGVNCWVDCTPFAKIRSILGRLCRVKHQEFCFVNHTAKP